MDRIALIGENSIEYISILLEIWNEGNSAVLLDWRLPFQTAVEMMNEAEVHKCFIEKNLWDKPHTSELSNILFIPFEKKSSSAEVLPENIYDRFRESYSRDEAIVLYSSGTTGKSKGIRLSHFAINTNADAIIDYMKPGKEDCIYIAKTLSHSSTLVGELLVALKSGSKLVIAPVVVTPRYVLNNIKKYSVSVICLNPTLLLMYAEAYSCGNYDLKSLKAIYVSGAILSNRVYSFAKKTFKDIAIYNVYGLSEAGPRVTAQTGDSCNNNSAGKPIKHVEISIIGEDGRELPNGECGIIHINTPCMYDGYVVGKSKLNSLYKGWLNSGDIGYIDESGDLYIIDRSDDIIIIDAHKIYPSEVEKIICSYSPIMDCIVAKMRRNDNFFELVCFYVSEEEQEPKELIRFLSSHLLTYEIPRKYIRVSVIAASRNGKRNRQEIIKYLNKE